MAAIEQVQRAFEAAPECGAKEVPKAQAIRMLIPQIRTMQSKGYDWEAIAGLLSEHGIAITAVTLRSYLQKLKTAGGKKPSPKRKGLPDVQGSIGSPPPAVDGVGTKEIAGARPRADKGAPAVPPRAAAPEVATEPTKAVRRPSDDGPARRSAFVPTEDSDDI